MRRPLLFGSTALLILATLLGAGLLAVEAHLFGPGHPLFAVQQGLESARVALSLRPAARADLTLSLAQNHLNDLALLSGTEHEAAALAAFDASLDRALRAVGALSADELPTARARLLALVREAIGAVAGLRPSPEVERVAARLDQIRRVALLKSSTGAGFLALVGGSGNPARQTAQAGPTASSVDPRAVPFPEGVSSHNFFPLEGAHAAAACEGCHAGGVYKGTPQLCEDCHTNPHPGQFGSLEADCANCHNTADFLQVSFDHAALDTADCQSCHGPAEMAREHRDVPNYDPNNCAGCHPDGREHDSNANGIPAGWRPWRHAGKSER